MVEDDLVLINRLLEIARQFVKDNGRIREIVSFRNVLEEVPISYICRPNYLERLMGEKEKCEHYKSLTITRVRFVCHFQGEPDELGRYKAGMGEQETYNFGIKSHITPEIAYNFETIAHQEGLLERKPNLDEINIDTSPLWEHEKEVAA